MPKYKKYICIQDCYQKIGEIPHKRYYAGEFYTFPASAKVPQNCFDEVKKPKEEGDDSKGLELLQKRLAELKNVKYPHPVVVEEIEEIEAKIAEIAGDPKKDLGKKKSGKKKSQDKSSNSKAK